MMESENITENRNTEQKNDSSVFDRDLSSDEITTNKDAADNPILCMNFIQREAVNYRRKKYCMLITVLLGLIFVLLVIAVVVQHKKLSTESDLMKMSYMNLEYSEALSSLEMNYSRLNGEREELQINLTYTIQKTLQLEAELKKWNSEKGLGWYFISREKKNWTESRQHCRDRGGDLVIIHTEEEQMLVSSITKERNWIGLSYNENESVLKWVDGTPLDLGFWVQGEPNGLGRSENCIEMLPSSQPKNNWNDAVCSIQNTFICEH
ncbi:CD209 antigen-like protein E [Triplophysa dalaica]|uniref:CD209 antigen-like protein E n=1 Tax=Triplophysa dalaica TaxID=1582913 RepID=UPI0024DFFB7D|nr:CD209 antigen-like protein E [Triplophysa dalaica]